LDLKDPAGEDKATEKNKKGYTDCGISDIKETGLNQNFVLDKIRET